MKHKIYNIFSSRGMAGTSDFCKTTVSSHWKRVVCNRKPGKTHCARKVRKWVSMQLFLTISIIEVGLENSVVKLFLHSVQI